MGLEFPDFKLKFDEKSNQFYWVGKKEFLKKVYYLKIIYPNEFPTIQPFVFVSEDNAFKKLLNFNQTIHRLNNGSICLFPWDYGEYGWKTYYSCADVINKFLDFVDLFKKNAIPKDHFSTPAEGFITFPSSIILQLNNKNDFFIYKRGTFHTIINPKTNSFQVQKISFKSNIIENKDLTLFNNSTIFPIPTFDLVWSRVSSQELNEISLIYDKNELLLYLKVKFPKWKLTNFQQPVCFISVNKKKNRIKTHCVANLSNQIRLDKINVFIGDIGDESVKRTKEVLTIDMEKFDKFMLCFIGIGSLGSEIALQLAKSGFKRFILVDPDILEPSNLSRHVLDIRSLHQNKAQAMAIYLLNKIFNITVTPYATSILAPNIIESILELSKKEQKELIFICTTNDLESENFINAVSIRENITTVYSSCSVRVEMGRIFRVIPKKTPCFYCISTEREKDKTKITFGESTTDWNQAPYTQGIPGIGFDVSIIGSFSAKLILETILNEIEPNHGYKTIQSDHIVVSLTNKKSKQIGVFEQNFYLDPSCPICSDVKPDQFYNDEVEKLKKQS